MTGVAGSGTRTHVLPNRRHKGETNWTKSQVITQPNVSAHDNAYVMELGSLQIYRRPRGNTDSETCAEPPPGTFSHLSPDSQPPRAAAESTTLAAPSQTLHAQQRHPPHLPAPPRHTGVSLIGRLDIHPLILSRVFQAKEASCLLGYPSTYKNPWRPGDERSLRRRRR